jgi:DNA-binding IclR family transcriptional regulator
VIGKLDLERHAKNTITDPDLLIAEIDLIEKREVSIDNQELYDDVVAIAVPIKDRHGRFYSSLAIQAPASRLSVENSDRYLPLLREAARELSLLADDD